MRLHLAAAVAVALLAVACGGGEGASVPEQEAGVDTGVTPLPDAGDDGESPADATTDAAVIDATPDAVTTVDAAADAGSPWPIACMLCHGSVNPAPPRALNSATATTDPGVGAHQSHLGPSSWHHEVQCSECHPVPTKPGLDLAFPSHRNNVTDLVWGPIAQTGTYSNSTTTCTGTYCHGVTLKADKQNVVSNRTPDWIKVDGTQKACGTSCHTTPPGGGHPSSTACETCHSAVVTSFTPGNPPTVVWKDASLHINGKIELGGGSLTCTSCHGDTVTNDPAPPRGTQGETTTSQLAVGAHTQHLSASAWHRTGVCSDCHTLPGSTSHTNGVTDFTWGPVSTAGGAQPVYASPTCTSVYCHGTTLQGPVQGGQVSRSPVWNVVNGSYKSCGNTCHTNPPGGTHPPMTNCPTCHGAVIATYDPITTASTWTSAALHVNGTVEVIPMTCTTCHGTSPSQINPPAGVSGESTTSTLAVGRHVAHLAASSTHVAFACNTCHVVPGNGDTTHASGYVASPSLQTAGHHGDVTFANQAVGMAFNVAATQGAPVTARGTCLGACHSNGRGGAPLVTPYWAGGAWTVGSCASCHAGTMSTLPARHPKHDGEATCADCHPPANSATHLNGKHDVNPTIIGSSGGGGGSVTTLPPGAVGNNCPAGQWQCTGTCHGKNHSPQCWQ